MVSYKDAGVDKEAGYEHVRRLKKMVDQTTNDQVLNPLGSFAALYELGQYRTPVLVSGTDGVGTKLKVAFALKTYHTVGIDLVAMCVNDILCHGAKPLFFLDYLACSQLDPQVSADLVAGIVEGCKQAGAALVGGETAEMPGFYQAGEYDMAGFAVGVVEKDQIIDGSGIGAGDQILALPSSGIHSNGYSLVRRLFGGSQAAGPAAGEVLSASVFLDADKASPQDAAADAGAGIGEGAGIGAGQAAGAGAGASQYPPELLEPTRIYVPDIQRVLAAGIRPGGLAHITGGGLIENVPRVLGPGLGAVIEKARVKVPAIFRRPEFAAVEEAEMWGTFNMGVGFVIVVKPEEVQQVQAVLDEAYVIGEIQASDEPIRLI